MTWATQYHDGLSPRALRTLVSCQVPHHRLPFSDCTSVSCVTAEPTTLCLQRNDFPFLNGSQVSPLVTRHPLNRYRVDVKSWQGCCVLAPDGRRMLRYTMPLLSSQIPNSLNLKLDVIQFQLVSFSCTQASDPLGRIKGERRPHTTRQDTTP